MEGKFIDVDGIQLYYYEKNPAALRTIFFIHGNSAGSRTWRKQWNDPLFSSYRLLAIDLPAHGQSSIAADPEGTYHLPGLGKLMARVVALLCKEKPYLLAGVSLATNIIAEMLPFGVQPLGMVLAGPCVVGEEAPVDKILKPDTHVSVVFTDEPHEEDVKKYGLEASHSKPEDLDLFLEDFYRVKRPFRSLLGQSITAKKYSDQIELLKQFGLPVLIVFGKDEKIVNSHYLDAIRLPLWNEGIVQIEGASHLVQIDQPTVVNRVVSDYAKDVFTKAGF